MSRSPYFYVERYNPNTEKYELQHPVIWNDNHTKPVQADLFPYNGCHDLFSIIEKRGFNNIFPEMRGIHNGLPHDVCEDILNEYNKYDYSTEYDEQKINIKPEVHWFSYADMYIYCLEHPKAIDYEAMELSESEKNIIYMDTPLLALKKRVDAFLEVMDDWDWEEDFSQIRIVYWIM